MLRAIGSFRRGADGQGLLPPGQLVMARGRHTSTARAPPRPRSYMHPARGSGYG